MKEFLVFIVSVVVLLGSVSCNTQVNQRENTREITDRLGRKVYVPESIERVVGVRAGALRMLTYMGATHRVVGIEEHEMRTLKPYTIAHPQLLQLPVIGPMMGGDSELILKVEPDVIFMSFATIADADALQKQTGIPVIVIDCPEFTAHRHLLYQSFDLMGNILNKKARADSLKSYIENMIGELDSLSAGIPLESELRAYVGGVSYRGSHGLTSTMAYYPPLEFAGVNNVANSLSSSPVSHVSGAFIDIEQLLLWNPDVIFIDSGGTELVLKTLAENKILEKNINALKNHEVHVLYAYNNYAANYEMILANSWYLARIIHPDYFAHICVEDKINEITSFFLGKPIFDELHASSGAYGQFYNLYN